MRFKKKLWGQVCRGERCDAYAIEHLQIDPNRCCSIHLHHFQHNQFILLAGTLAVLTWPHYRGMKFESGLDADEAYHGHPNERDGKDFEGFAVRVDRAERGKPKSIFVEAGILHQFVSLSDVQATEIYTPSGTGQLSPDDIQRFTTGGEVPAGLLDKIANLEW